MSQTFKLTLAYDGTAYHGWQRQLALPTVQGVVESALAAIVGQAVPVEGSSRTDAGVHALGQVVSFSCETALTPADLKRALNSQLPDDIVVVSSESAPAGFSARRFAVRKRYRYVIDDGETPEVFRRGYVWRRRRRLDEQAMHRAGQGIVGRHDFRSFETNYPSRVSSVRTVFDLRVYRGLEANRDLVAIEITGNGFLYNMVRTIAGTLFEVGRGRHSESWPAEVVAAQSRAAAGMTAPAQGLFLLDVEFG